jgi:nitroimidazol reductase NimA-like FMN-containing flavoprotein (pyridoxamine 5'-phosphate oxidase superfamily)
MFREVVRKKQAMTREACIELLIQQSRGVLAVQGDEGYPYAVPTNHFYDPESGMLLFHSGKSGHKVDAFRNSDKVSYCVTDEGTRMEGDWAKTYRSVIVFGRVEIVDDYRRAMDIVRRLSLQFTGDTDYIEYEIEHFGEETLVFAIVPEHITGKTIREA